MKCGWHPSLNLQSRRWVHMCYVLRFTACKGPACWNTKVRLMQHKHGHGRV